VKFICALSMSPPEHYAELATVAEQAGWYGVTVSDHVFVPAKLDSKYPYHEDGVPAFDATTPWADPWVAVGAMAAVTQRLRFLTNVYILPLRHPLLVAKSVGTAAVISGNRVALGFGVGWMREEFDVLGAEFARRGRRTDEMIAILRKVWAGGMVEHHGEFYDFDALQMSPAPTRPIPIYGGGLSEAAFRRAGTLCDGWISVIHSVEELRAMAGRLHAQRRQAGREGQPFEIFASATDAFDLDGYRRCEDAGVTGLVTMPWYLYGGRPDSLADKKAGLERFGNDVIAKLR
jgi:probable F420-dependent oxidoreductase